MVLLRNLKYGMSGTDVRYVKELLFSLGFYEGIEEIKLDRFGTDTLKAVRRFQKAAAVKSDGIVGPITYAALLKRAGLSAEEARDTRIPAHIGDIAAKAIAADLNKESGLRLKIALEALDYAYDPTVPAPYPRSLYIRGGNLYTTALRPFVITAARIHSGAEDQPQYYANGSKEMMLGAVAANPSITGADCSGGVVGLWRKYGLVRPTWDRTANGIASEGKTVTAADIRPGDLAWRSGHIGICVGGGYVVEWMGSLYGCQLSRIDKRQGYDFVGRKLRSRSGWMRFVRPPQL